MNDVTPEEIASMREQLERDGSILIADQVRAFDTIGRLRAQLAARPAPVAVEVPELTERDEELLRCVERALDKSPSMFDGYMGDGMMAWEASIALDSAIRAGRAIPSSSILKDGHVQVPVEDWKELRAFARISGYPEGRFTAEVPFGKDFEKWGTDIARRMGITRGEEQAWIDAIRSGEAEGGKG